MGNNNNENKNHLLKDKRKKIKAENIFIIVTIGI